MEIETNKIKIIQNLIKDLFLNDYPSISDREFNKIYHSIVYILDININILIGTIIFFLEARRFIHKDTKKKNINKYINNKFIFLGSLLLSFKSFSHDVDINKKVSNLLDIDYDKLRILELDFLNFIDDNIYIKDMELEFVKKIISHNITIKNGNCCLFLNNNTPRTNF